ncbi:MAG: ABC transporter ATP-binding protein [Bdellovibrionota bacterium]
MAEIQLKRLAKRYGNMQVVHEIDLEISAGEFVVLVGPSGCGKSTTLRMIAGLEEITSGDLLFGTKRMNNVRPKDRDIAMVFQNYALYPHMTVRENLSFGLKLRRTPPDQIAARVAEVAAILELGSMLDRKPGQLSGGQRQRVAMGRAIARKPKVYLFDEPLSNLDAKLRNQMRAEIKKLHMMMKTTVVYVTHDQVEAMTLADRIVVMKDGRIQQVGTPMEIYSRPANAFVASFIGSPPMNFVELGGKQVGMRPEHLRLSSGSLKNAQKYGAKVELVEPLGGETLIHALLHEQKVIARIEGSATARPGDNIDLFIESENQKFFDKNSGAAL